MTAGSCTPAEPPAEIEPPVYPPPPAIARYRHELALRSGDDLFQRSSSERLRRLALGLSSAGEASLEKPFAVAAAKGRIFVTDTVLAAVHAFDIPRRRYFRFGYRREGTLRAPLGIAVAPNGTVMVADRGRAEIVVFDPLGLYLRAFGRDVDLERVTDIAISPQGDRMLLVDAGGLESDRHRLVEVDANGRTIRSIGTRGTAPGEFNLPTAATYLPDGRIAALDAGNFRVQVLDSDGHHLRSFGAVGDGPGQLARPKDIAADLDGNLFVSDTAFGNVQIFTSQGELLMSLGSFDRRDTPGGFVLLSGIAIDETRRVYAVDQLHRKIEVFRRLP